MTERLADDQMAADSATPPTGPSGEGATGTDAAQAARPDGVPADRRPAGRLRETTASLFHFATMFPVFKGIDAGAYQCYRDRLLADCGGPTDPIEVMIIEQLSLAHFGLGLLSCKTADTTKPEAVGIFAGAAARLMGEFRRSALALQAYRAASRRPAYDPTRDLVLPAEPADPEDEPSGRFYADGELLATTEERDAGDGILPYTRPDPLGDQPPQLPAEARHEPRRKGPGPRRNPAAPAVGAVHGSANG